MISKELKSTEEVGREEEEEEEEEKEEERRGLAKGGDKIGSVVIRSGRLKFIHF